MVEITLFEIHLENATFDADATANAPLSRLFGRGEESEDDAESASVAESGESGSGGIGVGKILLGVALLGALAALATRLLGSDDVEDLVEMAGEPVDIETDPDPVENEVED